MMSIKSTTTWTYPPEEPFELLKAFGEEEGSCLIFTDEALYLALFPDEKIELRAQPGCWQTLKERISDAYYVGYLGYEMGHFADSSLSIEAPRSSLPDALFYRPSTLICYDRKNATATLYGKALPKERKELPRKKNALHFLRASDTLESYLEKIANVKRFIEEGEVYQVNLCQTFHFGGKVAPLALFEALYHKNPAPRAAFVNCGGFHLLSLSPELFVEKRGSQIITMPIKGTSARGRSEKEDELLKQELLQSEKERSELLMITDLLRNDLSKISQPGSVETLSMWECCTYTDVFHLQSTIRGELREGHPVDQMRALFPGGSITGCPKLRAMDVIAQLEKSARGPYSGAIGLFTPEGDFSFNIAIRTLVTHPEGVEVKLGGGIVYDSDPQKEYEETLHKGGSIFKVLNQGH